MAALGEFNGERTSVHDDGNAVGGSPCETCSHGRGACACTTSHRDTTAALPYTHADGTVGAHRGKLDVATLGEDGSHLECPTLVLYVHRLNIGNETHKVGITHGNKGALMTDAEVFHKAFAHASVGCGHLRGVSQASFPHVNGHGVYKAVVAEMQVEHLDARKGFEVDDGFVGKVVVVDILCHASYAVAAHATFGAVVVEHTHAEIALRGLGRANKDEPVATDAFMAVAPKDGEFFGVSYGEARCVNVHIVVAGTVHFCELNGLGHRGGCSWLVVCLVGW